MTLHFSTGRPFAAIAIAAAALFGSAQAGAVPLLGLTTTNGLVTFDSATPGTGSAVQAISGLTSGERIIDIDLRPTTGVVYGLSDASRIYAFNSFGAATLVGSLSTTLAGGFGSIDFNPVADLNGAASLRVVSTTGQNLAFNVASGATVVQTTIQSGISSVAYTNSDTNPATGTALYYLDASADMLRFASTAFDNPTLATAGPLGFDLAGAGGFDIVGNEAFGALSTTGGARNGLYSINLGTGTASYLGAFGGSGGTYTLQGLTAAAITTPIPEPSTYALLAIGLAGVGFAARKRRAG